MTLAVAMLQQTPDADAPSYGWAAVRMLLALVIVVALLLIVARLLPRWLSRPRPPVGGEEIQIVSSRPLEPGRTLYIIRAKGREYLIATSEHGVHAISGTPLDAPDRPPARDFSAVLAQQPPVG